MLLNKKGPKLALGAFLFAGKLGLLFTVTSAITCFVTNYFFIGAGAAGIAVGLVAFRGARRCDATYAGIDMTTDWAVFSGAHLRAW